MSGGMGILIYVYIYICPVKVLDRSSYGGDL